jgi:hypothetical protein
MNWQQKTLSGLMLLVLVAWAGRAAYELLAPALPLLVSSVIALGLFAYFIGRFRR